MGSVNAAGVPVVSKDNESFRNRAGRQIYKTDSRSDVETVLVPYPPTRVEGSGSIVRNNNSVDFYVEQVNGLYMGGRSASARVASKPGVTRDLDVELGDNKTIAVVETALVAPTPQIGVSHLGSRVTVNTSTDDSHTRVSDSGVFGLS